jgi:hypothetical protein
LRRQVGRNASISFSLQTNRTSFTAEMVLPSATSATEFRQNRKKINEADSYTPAHNGLVAGSSPAGLKIEDGLIDVSFRSPHQKLICFMMHCRRTNRALPFLRQGSQIPPPTEKISQVGRFSSLMGCRARLARVDMEGDPMNTAFLLMAQYGGKAIVPIEDVCRDYFSHLNAAKLVQKISAGEIAIPLVRMEASQKCAKGVYLLDLAKYLDARVEAARKEMTALTT